MVLCAGFLLDAIIGDPQWLPHPVQGIGWIIARLEVLLRKIFPKNSFAEQIAGTFLVLIICAISFAVPYYLLRFVTLWSYWAAFLLESLMCWQVLAVKSLRDAAMKVYDPLIDHNIIAARRSLSMIVGRDTENLGEEGVAKATVETVAENTNDGVVAPMLFFAIGGAPLAFLYKGINTMDSMIAYNNNSYAFFGRTAARLDDVANFVPARAAGLLMVVAAALAKKNWRMSWRILWRDHNNHKSPNAAWTEAACAGALEVELGGKAKYSGITVEKPTIGDPIRNITAEDIKSACLLEVLTSSISLILCVALRLLLYFL